MDKLHENIKSVRIRQGYSQEQIAEEMGIDRSTYNKFESGKTRLFTPNMMRFKAAVGMSEEEILLGDHPKGYLREGSLEDRIEELSLKIDMLFDQVEDIASAIRKILKNLPKGK